MISGTCGQTVTTSGTRSISINYGIVFNYTPAVIASQYCFGGNIHFSAQEPNQSSFIMTFNATSNNKKTLIGKWLAIGS